MIFGMKKLEMLGGIGSILTGFICVGIGAMDYATGQSWKIWAIMTVVLVVNGVAMLFKAATRSEQDVLLHAVSRTAKAHS